MKICGKCGKLLDFSMFNKRKAGGFQSRCKPCHAEDMRYYRAKNPELYRQRWRESYQRHKEKRIAAVIAWKKRTGSGYASVIVSNAVKRGDLPNLKTEDIACVKCGMRRAVNYHHKDYNKPLDVIPVCHRCNRTLGPAKPKTK